MILTRPLADPRFPLEVTTNILDNLAQQTNDKECQWALRNCSVASKVLRARCRGYLFRTIEFNLQDPRNTEARAKERLEGLLSLIHANPSIANSIREFKLHFSSRDMPALQERLSLIHDNVLSSFLAKLSKLQTFEFGVTDAAVKGRILDWAYFKPSLRTAIVNICISPHLKGIGLSYVHNIPTLLLTGARNLSRILGLVSVRSNNMLRIFSGDQGNAFTNIREVHVLLDFSLSSRIARAAGNSLETLVVHDQVGGSPTFIFEWINLCQLPSLKSFTYTSVSRNYGKRLRVPPCAVRLKERIKAIDASLSHMDGDGSGGMNPNPPEPLSDSEKNWEKFLFGEMSRTDIPFLWENAEDEIKNRFFPNQLRIDSPERDLALLCPQLQNVRLNLQIEDLLGRRNEIDFFDDSGVMWLLQGKIREKKDFLPFLKIAHAIELLITVDGTQNLEARESRRVYGGKIYRFRGINAK